METQIHVPVGSPVIRKIPVFVDEHNVTEGAMQLIKELRPSWETSSVQTKVILAAKLCRARLRLTALEHHQAPPCRRRRAADIRLFNHTVYHQLQCHYLFNKA